MCCAQFPTRFTAPLSQIAFNMLCEASHTQSDVIELRFHIVNTSGMHALMHRLSSLLMDNKLLVLPMATEQASWSSARNTPMCVLLSGIMLLQ